MVTGSTSNVITAPLSPVDKGDGPSASFHPLTAELAEALRADVPGLTVLTDPSAVERLSKDFYWYSPVLKRQLEDKRADGVAQPTTVEQVAGVLRFAALNGVPITARGSGTGNYGQSIPLHGGLVLDLAKLDGIFEIEPDGIARCQPGARLGAIEVAARKVGWELRCYPSTFVKASVGGFLAGGSGGIGSISHGGLRDAGTVVSVDILTMEPEPRRLRLEGPDLFEVLHAYGTNGILVEIRLGLTPKVPWAQLAAAFDTWEGCFDFAEAVARDETYRKRLVTPFEWPIPSFFTPVRRLTREGKALVFFEVDDAQLDRLRTEAEAAGGEVTFTQNYAEPRPGPLLSDYTWNHTTLWAIKASAEWTYLQTGFDPEPARVREQFRLLKERYPTEFYFHIEFAKWGKVLQGFSAVVPGAIPLVRFTTEARLREIIAYCREIGVNVADPHVYTVEDGGRGEPDDVQTAAKFRYDPRGLLNPGKMRAFSTAAYRWQPLP